MQGRPTSSPRVVLAERPPSTRRPGPSVANEPRRLSMRGALPFTASSKSHRRPRPRACATKGNAGSSSRTPWPRQPPLRVRTFGSPSPGLSPRQRRQEAAAARRRQPNNRPQNRPKHRPTTRPKRPRGGGHPGGAQHRSRGRRPGPPLVPHPAADPRAGRRPDCAVLAGRTAEKGRQRARHRWVVETGAGPAPGCSPRGVVAHCGAH